MRILFVVPNVPSPIRPRPFHFIRRISQIHQVSVVCLATNDTDQGFVSDLGKYCNSVEVIWLPRWRSFANCLLALFSRTSLRCAYFNSSTLRDRVRALVEAKEVDLIHVEHLKSVAMVKPVLGRVPAVFDAVDCLSMLETRRCSIAKNPLAKFFAWTESRKLARSEAEASRQFSRVVISSPVDREAYPSPGGLEKIEAVSNGVDLAHFGFRQFETQTNLLVFCAKLDYFPNEDAALYFARSIWPILKARRPELIFEIVGSRPPRSIRRLDGRNNIRVIASVPDVRPYLGRACVALCPIRIRAGIQNKMLEAMALGVPLVATPVCLQGLEIEAGKHLLTADGPLQFVSAIESLLDNVPIREKLVREARAYVEQQHDWADSVRALLAAYGAALADFTAGANPSISDTIVSSDQAQQPAA